MWMCSPELKWTIYPWIQSNPIRSIQPRHHAITESWNFHATVVWHYKIISVRIRAVSGWKPYSDFVTVQAKDTLNLTSHWRLTSHCTDQIPGLYMNSSILSYHTPELYNANDWWTLFKTWCATIYNLQPITCKILPCCSTLYNTSAFDFCTVNMRMCTYSYQWCIAFQINIHIAPP